MSKPIDFYYDYASPFAYIANGTLEKKLSGCEIRFRPIYLRGFESFSKGIPFVPAKLRYLATDVHRCARYEGLPERRPDVFPVNGIYACRGDLVAQEMGKGNEFRNAAFLATWGENRNVADKGVVAEIAVSAGLDAEQFAARMESQEIKDRLKAQTEAAEKLGLFGVPSFVVGEELFWGHDRMDYVLRAAQE